MTEDSGSHAGTDADGGPDTALEDSGSGGGDRDGGDSDGGVDRNDCVDSGEVPQEDPNVLRINFQLAGEAPPLRMGIVHLEDSGEAYGDRGNGHSYGFSQDRTHQARRRNAHPDARFDGHVKLGNRSWELELDNGDYLVNLVIGDPDYMVANNFTLEGTAIADPDGADYFDEYEGLAVTVNDGKLTIEGGDDDTPLCFLEVVEAARGFSNVALPVPDPMQRAFPGAEGQAKFLSGGRYGDVYHVTNLNWSGPGSLAWGFQTVYGDHPRTIVFDVSGHIAPPAGADADGEMLLVGDNITVAGQSAPGKGITIRDHTVKIKNGSNLIFRYLRFRLGDQKKGNSSGADCVTAENNDGLMMDHLSMSWSIDGIMDSRSNGRFTVQWSIFAEPLHDSIHYEGGSHGYLMSFRDLNAPLSVHHNLFSSGSTRHPTLGSSALSENMGKHLSEIGRAHV